MINIDSKADMETNQGSLHPDEDSLEYNIQMIGKASNSHQGISIILKLKKKTYFTSRGKNKEQCGRVHLLISND